MTSPNQHPSSNIAKHLCSKQFAVKRLDGFYNTIAKLIELVPHSRILNLGCGEGFDIKRIFQGKNTKFDRYCGLDLNFEALQIAKNELRNPDLINGNVYDVPLRLDKFNVVLCLEVLEHLKFPEKVLVELSRHSCSPCIFSVPNEPLYRLTRMLVFRQNIGQLGNHPEHVQNWSKNIFLKLIEKYFTVDYVDTPFPWTVILCHSKR